MSPANGSPITVSLRRSTLTPAVFVAGTFSDPHWEPLELTAKPLESDDLPHDKKDSSSESAHPTEYLFSRQFSLPHGQYEYKFREGVDGPWFCDPEAKTGIVNS